MTEDGGRELTPREPGEVESSDSAITPAPDADSRAVERFSAGPRAHMVGLTEERSAQIVRQSGNARSVLFLAILVIALFIPVYWFYESGIPVLGAGGRLEAEAQVQYVTDVSRGYELFLANCARCHGADGQGGVGPPLNSQPKLYNALTADLQPGTGHLNPNYVNTVLTVGGRYVCGDPDSQMDAWSRPDGPLTYRQIEELIAWITASSDISFEYETEAHGGASDEENAGPTVVRGWRDPDWEPEPGATPPPACWRAPEGLTAVTEGGGPDALAAPVTAGTPDAPRVIRMDATSTLTFTDEDGVKLEGIAIVEGETIQFEVVNTAGFEHNFYIGEEEELMAPNGSTAVGIAPWPEGPQTLTWTADTDGVSLQFACTIPGHYQTMHGDIVIQV
jgi:mono/diheme cytochrome c family protein/uncharacterized cupredoxin-like copper-binding protein